MKINKDKLSCPLCKKNNYSKYIALPGYTLNRCADCSMVWDPETESEDLKQYENDYFLNDNPKGGYANYFEGMNVNKKTFEDRIKKIEKKYKKGKLLDVGCAFGDFLVAAKKRGWKNPEGIEVSSYAAGKARDSGLKINQKPLSQWKKYSNAFDVITYQDVIEHVTDPLEELVRVKKILKPGGHIFLITPDIGGWWSKVLGRYWYHYKPGEHVVYFSQATMRFALAKAGFTNIVTKKTYHILSIQYVLNRLRYYSSLIFGTLLKVIKKTPFKDYSFKAYTGELEAWASKPL